MLSRGLDVFAESARVGDPRASVVEHVRQTIAAPGSEVTAELVLHGNGNPVDQAALGQARFSKSDVLTLHLAGCGGLGYWYELSGLFAFDRLSGEADRRLRAVELMYQAAMLRMASGRDTRALRGALDDVLMASGLGTTGGGAVVCQPISRRRPGAASEALDFTLESNMVVVFRPSVVGPSDSEFQIAETMLVRPDGAVPMSPRGSIFRRIRA